MLTTFWIAFCFLVSGACGLLYETVWVKQLSYVFGNTILATTLVFTAFMAGLALGAGILGSRADRHPRPLRLYGWLEIGITLSVMAFPPLLALVRDLHHRLLLVSALPAWAPVAFEFIALLLLLVIPTMLMGATLPILCRWAAARGGHAGRSLGLLYGLNNLGAVLGSVSAGFFLVRFFGLDHTQNVAMVLNATVGVIALVLDSWLPASEVSAPLELNVAGSTPADSPAVPGGATPAPVTPVTVLHVALFTAGFAAMLFEIALMKVLPLVLGSSTYSFSLMLAAFIAGLAGGSALAGLFLPGVRDPAKLLAWLLILAGLAFLATLPVHNRLPGLYLVLRDGFGDNSFVTAMVLGSFVCFLSMFLPTLAMGAMFPVAAGAVAASSAGAEGREGVARQVGRLYAINTAGNIAGTLATGLLFVPHLGFRTTMELGVFLQVASGILVLARTPGTRRVTAVTTTACLGIGAGYALLAPRPDALALSAGVFRPFDSSRGMGVEDWLHADREIIFSEEDAMAFVTLEKSAGGQISLRVNGKVDASSHGDMQSQRMAAHLPLVLHPGPRTMAIIGLGCGATVSAALTHPLESIECVELSPAVIRASRHFQFVNGDIEADRRLQLIQGDGRAHMEHSPRRYDVIASEPSNPWLAGISALFTREFFETEKNHLNKGGVMCQWLQVYEMDPETFRLVVRTFRQVFPVVEIFRISNTDVMMLGSMEPIALDPAALDRGFARGTVRADLEKIGVMDPMIFIGHHLVDSTQVAELAGPGTLNTDDFPVLEYLAPLAFHARRVVDLPDSVYRTGSSRSPLRAYLAVRTPTTQQVLDFCRAMEEDYDAVTLGAMLGEALAADPDHAELRRVRAMFSQKSGDLRGAWADLQILHERDPEQAGLQAVRFEVAWAMESRELSFRRIPPFTGAIDAASQMIRQHPENYLAHARLARVHFMRQDWAGAAAAYRGAIAAGLKVAKANEEPVTELAGYHIALASCLVERGEIAAANEALSAGASLGTAPIEEKPRFERLKRRMAEREAARRDSVPGTMPDSP